MSQRLTECGPSKPMDADRFDGSQCLNCADPRLDRWCPRCGQPRVQRLGIDAIWTESWSRWRVFEFSVLRALWHVLQGPGRVALEYVRGARKRHIHPLKLWLFVAAAQLLILQRSGYLDAQDPTLQAALSWVQAWSNPAFALGGLAIWLATVIALRHGYTLAEHAVLAAYAHSVVLAIGSLFKLPVLLWRAPAFLALHQAWAPRLQDLVGVSVVALATRQFFALQGIQGLLRLLPGIALFLILKWALLSAFGHALSAWIRAELTHPSRTDMQTTACRAEHPFRVLLDPIQPGEACPQNPLPRLA